MQRMKTRPQFQAALAGGTVARTPHFALHRLALEPAATLAPVPAESDPPSSPLFRPHDVWLGALVPKRWAKRAATRNTIRRQIYAVSAPLAGQLPVAAHVVRLRAGFDRQVFVSASSEPLRQSVREELIALFDQALPTRRRPTETAA